MKNQVFLVVAHNFVFCLFLGEWVGNYTFNLDSSIQSSLPLFTLANLNIFKLAHARLVVHLLC